MDADAGRGETNPQMAQMGGLRTGKRFHRWYGWFGIGNEGRIHRLRRFHRFGARREKGTDPQIAQLPQIRGTEGKGDGSTDGTDGSGLGTRERIHRFHRFWARREVGTDPQIAQIPQIRGTRNGSTDGRTFEVVGAVPSRRLEVLREDRCLRQLSKPRCRRSVSRLHPCCLFPATCSLLLAPGLRRVLAIEAHVPLGHVAAPGRGLVLPRCRSTRMVTSLPVRAAWAAASSKATGVPPSPRTPPRCGSSRRVGFTSAPL